MGIGFETAKLVYAKSGNVYIAGRNRPRMEEAIAALKQEYPESQGRLGFFSLDLADLATIKPAVAEFIAKENRLDVLFCNAGVMVPPAGSKTVQVRGTPYQTLNHNSPASSSINSLLLLRLLGLRATAGGTLHRALLIREVLDSDS